jgi:TolA-binding protein
MAVHKVGKKRGLVLNNQPFKVVNTDRETVASLGSKLRSAISEIEKLKERLNALEEKVEELES